MAIDEYRFEDGDTIEVSTDRTDNFLFVQLDDTLTPSLLYIPGRNWTYRIGLSENDRNAAPPSRFTGDHHVLTVRRALEQEVLAYRDLSHNSHDQAEPSGAYPHVEANRETRGEAVFAGRCVIDGKLFGSSHGQYPFTSWGVDNDPAARLTVDFGHPVMVRLIRVLIRSDFPHDSYWTSLRASFSDGTSVNLTGRKTAEFQDYPIPALRTTFVTLDHLVKADDESPFPALTQLNVYGETAGLPGSP